MSHETFIQRLAKNIANNYNLANQELTIVFPNKRAAFYLRSEFKKSVKGNIWLPRMVSVEEAVTQWSGLTLIDSMEMLFELVDIDAHLHPELGSDLTLFGSQAAQMAKDFDEIDQYGIDAHHLFNYVVENKRLEIWNLDLEKNKEMELKHLQFFQSLLPYYTTLRNRLLAQKKGYYGLITRQLAEMPEQELLERIGQRKIIFAGFNALTTTEERIIDKLVRNGMAETVFDYDSYYVGRNDNEAGLFARKYLRAHPKWLQNGIGDSLNKEKKTIHIVGAAGNTLQTKALQQNLQRSQNADTAVVLADERLLIPVLNAIPDTEAYRDLKVSMGYPLKETPVDAFVKAFLKLRRWKKTSRTTDNDGQERMSEGWYLWPILRIMDLEMVRIAFPTADTAAFDKWKQQAVSDGKFLFSDADLDTLSFVPDIRELLKIMLRPYSDKQNSSNILLNVSDLLVFLAEISQRNGKEKEAVFLLNQISEAGKIINRLRRIADRHADYIGSHEDVEILYRLLSSGASIKLNGSGTDGLQVMGLLETRNLDFPTLHVVSLNEGILPADKPQGSFIPQYIKRECGLPGYTEKQAVFAYHFYHLLQNGKDIYLYHNNLDTDAGSEPSRYILQLRYELSLLDNISIVEEPFEAMETKTPEKHKLTASKASSIERLRQIVAEKGISPSSLSIYLQCPMKFRFKYLEGIKDKTPEEEIGTDVTGNITHDTLEFLFEDYKPNDGKTQIISKELFDNQIFQKWEQCLTRAVAKNLPLGFPDMGFNYLKMVGIKQQLKNYLQYTSEQLKHNDLTILKTEEMLKAVLPSAAGDCLFSGRTDRIDRCGERIRVIDYKTGKVENADLAVPARNPEDTDLNYLKTIPEKALQLLLYKFMYLNENQDVAPSQVEVGIHCLRHAGNIGFSLTYAKGDETRWDDANFMDTMETLLQSFVKELFDETIPFAQTPDNKKCRYCDFKEICGR